MKYRRYDLEGDNNFATKVNDIKIFKYPEQFKLYDFDFFIHWHPAYEIIYVLDGSLTINTDGDDIIVNKNEVYFLNSEEIHFYANTQHKANKDLRFILLNIPLKMVEPYFKITDSYPAFVIDDETARKNIITVMDLLYNMENYNAKFEDLRIKAIVNYILFQLTTYCYKPDFKYPKGSDSSDFDCAKQAKMYMTNNYKKDITLPEIAKFVGMTPSHFSKYFKEKIGTTFLKYLRRVRLEHALNDICLNNMSVKKSAETNGFPNVNALITACKEVYEKTPNELKALQGHNSD